MQGDGGGTLDAGSPINDYLRRLHEQVKGISGGDVATYIPELAKANPAHCAIAIATVDGNVYVAGDANQTFTIQSISKPFLYGFALEQHGREKVLKHVGVEPTGEAFNSTVLDEDNNRPYNPMVNAGAIAVSALVKGNGYAARREAMRGLFSRFVGRDVDIDEEVFRSERETGDRNRAIAALMEQAAMMEGDTNEILDLYFSQCSVLVTCRDLALMAATLANGGVHPQTGERALANEYVHDVLTVMNSCGMYNYAGQWSYEVGIPAKSGVSGGIAAVIPGQVGIAAWSPPLDRVGNSVRAIAACKQMAEEFGLHVFRTPPSSGTTIRGRLSGAEARSKRVRGPADQAILAAHGASVRLVEIQGALFFGSAERVVREVSAIPDEADFVILDLRRVSSADKAACALFLRLRDDLASRGKRLLVAHLPATGSLANLHASLDERRPGIIFADRDTALEFAENEILAAQRKFTPNPRHELADVELFAGLSQQDLKIISRVAREVSFEAGDMILKEGEAAQEFYVLASGAASVRLGIPGDGATRSIRIATLGPGATTGEMALLDGGKRSADVVADQMTRCHVFSVDALRKAMKSRQAGLNVIYANLARNLSERLRAVNREIRALEQ